MYFRVYTIFLALLINNICAFSRSPNINDCINYNQTFLPGEELSYILSYNWFILYYDVAEVSLRIKKDSIFGKEAIYFGGMGSTFKWWDKFFQVRDKYEVWVNPENLRPYYFKRNIREGNYRQQVSYVFKDEDTLTYSKCKTNDNPLKEDTIQITPCTYDVMSAMLWARNVNLSRHKPGDKIPVTVILDLESYDLYFRYLGKETIKVKGLGHVECNKFSVLLVEGTLFHEGEDMFVWVTNDKNRIPVYAESPILIGSVKVRLIDVKGNRYPITAFDTN